MVSGAGCCSKRCAQVLRPSWCPRRMIGFLLGVRLQRTSSQQRCATIVLITLLGVGLSLVRSSVMGWRSYLLPP